MFTAGNFVNYTYDNIGQLKTAKGYEEDGSPRLNEQFGYAYDAAWNLNYRTNHQLVQSFGVNNLNELTTSGRSGTLTVAGTVGQASPPVSVTVSGTGFNTTDAATVYEDGSWARPGATPGNGQNSYTANATDAYGRTSQDTVTVNLTSSVSFYYDGNGSLTNHGLRTIEYDTENQLTTITVSNAWRSEFQYDGLMRRRIRREFTWTAGHWVNTNEVHYLLDGFLVIQERTPLNIPALSFTRGTDLSGTLQNAGGIGGMLALSESPSVHYYYQTDASGNITALVDARNSLVASYRYDPYGNAACADGPKASLNLYRFSSKEQHPNSGTYYFTYRFYEPALQRWVNSDPLGDIGSLPVITALISPTIGARTSGRVSEGALFKAVLDINRNLYAAVRNNPVGFLDPDGMDPAFCPDIGMFQGLTPDQMVAAARQAAPAAALMLVSEVLGIAAAEVAAVRLASALAAAGRASSARAAAQGAYWQAKVAHQAAIGDAIQATARGANVLSQAEQLEASAATVATAYARLRQAERAEKAAKAAVAACSK